MEVRLADEDCAVSTKHPDDGRIFGRRMIRPYFRRGCRRKSGDVDEILDGNRNAVERTAVYAAGALGVGSACRRARARGVDDDEGIGARPMRIDRSEGFLEEAFGGHVSAPEVIRGTFYRSVHCVKWSGSLILTVTVGIVCDAPRTHLQIHVRRQVDDHSRALMSELAFRDGVMDRLRLIEPRFDEHAYLFVLAALEFSQTKLPERRHISGPELADACRGLALERYGVMSRVVLEHWGIRSTRDIGDVVFALVEFGLLISQPTDTKDDFIDIFDFDRAFERDYPWNAPA
jgi:uncharacterized repeat protein (TIGR04138 family)